MSAARVLVVDDDEDIRSLLRTLLERAGVDPAAIEDVIFGCVDTLGPQGVAPFIYFRF